MERKSGVCELLIIYLQFKISPSVDERYKLLYNYGNLGKDVFF